MFEIIYQLIAGLIVGMIARLILPGRENFPPGAIGWLLTAVLGIAGAFLGTILHRLIPFTSANYAAGWIMSILGAIILLLLYRMVMGRGSAAQ
ncbi:MAG: GlsB/YeaQ/YmgE family stress response membrane protein [Acidobacteriota bacterium]